MGTSSHAMGTAESMKINELKAMSSIAMVISGIVLLF